MELSKPVPIKVSKEGLKSIAYSFLYTYLLRFPKRVPVFLTTKGVRFLLRESLELPIKSRSQGWRESRGIREAKRTPAQQHYSPTLDLPPLQWFPVQILP